MSNKIRAQSVALATAAAVLFSSLPLQAASAAETGKVKCEGVNGCKGQSACATAKNACQGHNSCKGTGYLLLTQAECDAAKAKMSEGKK
jgi:hypothetical protein